MTQEFKASEPMNMREAMEKFNEKPKVTKEKHDAYVEGLKDGIQAERDGVTYREFNLSAKETTMPLRGYPSKDVKEFIKLLNEDFFKASKPFKEEYGLFVSEKRFLEIIDKRAGDKLI